MPFRAAQSVENWGEMAIEQNDYMNLVDMSSCWNMMDFFVMTGIHHPPVGNKHEAS